MKHELLRTNISLGEAVKIQKKCSLILKKKGKKV
ncbi:hypothetical protein ES703_100404 [subsurface metagenome]